MDMPKPVPVALIVCDSVYKETRGKTALVGLFNTIRAGQFPAHHTRICVYAAVTSARPTDRYKLELVHSETDEILFSTEGPPPEQITPLAICEFTFTFDDLVFKKPGLYHMRFWGNDHLLLQRPLTVTKLEEKPREE